MKTFLISSKASRFPNILSLGKHTEAWLDDHFDVVVNKEPCNCSFQKSIQKTSKTWRRVDVETEMILGGENIELSKLPFPTMDDNAMMMVVVTMIRMM